MAACDDRVWVISVILGWFFQVKSSQVKSRAGAPRRPGARLLTLSSPAGARPVGRSLRACDTACASYVQVLSLTHVLLLPFPPSSPLSLASPLPRSAPFAPTHRATSLSTSLNELSLLSPPPVRPFLLCIPPPFMLHFLLLHPPPLSIMRCMRSLQSCASAASPATSPARSCTTLSISPSRTALEACVASVSAFYSPVFLSLPFSPHIYDERSRHSPSLFLLPPHASCSSSRVQTLQSVPVSSAALMPPAALSTESFSQLHGALCTAQHEDGSLSGSPHISTSPVARSRRSRKI